MFIKLRFSRESILFGLDYTLFCGDFILFALGLFAYGLFPSGLCGGPFLKKKKKTTVCLQRAELVDVFRLDMYFILWLFL